MLKGKKVASTVLEKRISLIRERTGKGSFLNVPGRRKHLIWEAGWGISAKVLGLQ
jgi:hypothetical protein